MRETLEKLAGGDRRSIGGSDEVVAEVLEDPTLFDAVSGGILNEDPVIQTRSADAVEKITAEYPEYLRPYKEKLIQQVAGTEHQEVRWHVAQMLPRLSLIQEERVVALSILLGYLNDESRIVRTFWMQALADLAEKDPSLRPRVIELLTHLTKAGTPAMKSRGRKLLDKLNKGNDEAGR